MATNAVPTPGDFPLQFNERDAKVIQTATLGTGTISNKTIDSSNTIAGAALTAASVPPAKLSVSATAGNILVAAASTKVWTDVAMSGDITITSAGATAIGSTKVTNAMLAGSIAAAKMLTAPSHAIVKVLTNTTGTVATGAAVGDLAIYWTLSSGVVAIAPVATIDTNPHTVAATGDYTIFVRAAS
jgi:hypothetical protein